MALTRTDVGVYESKTGNGTAAFATGSFTPPANSLLVIAVGFISNGLTGDIGTPTIEGGGLTYTSRATAFGLAAWAMKLAIFTAPVGASPSSMTITVDDDNNQDIFGWTVAVTAFTGYDTTTPVAGAVSSAGTNIGDGEEKQTLGATPAEADVSMLFIYLDSSTGPPKPTLAAGWTKIYDAKTAGEGGLATARREASTSTEVKVTDVFGNVGSFAKGSLISLIVKASTGATVTDLAGTLAGVGALSGVLTTVAGLIATLTGTGTINGELRTIASLQASPGGLGTINGQLVTVASLSAALSGTGSLAGELRVLASLAAALTGTGAIAGQLTDLATMAAQLEGSGHLDGRLTDVASLAAALTGSGSLLGLLELVLGQRLVLPTRAVVVPSRPTAAAVAASSSRARVRLNRSTLAAVVPSRPSTATIAAAASRAVAHANKSTRARISRRVTRTKLHR